MSNKTNILIFSGSIRTGSFNTMLAKIAAQVAQEEDINATLIDLKHYPSPIYNGDLESEKGIPEHVESIKSLMKTHDAFIIASPEYNSSYSPLLKNIIDWASRKSHPDEEPLICFKNKIVGLVSASPGRLGGLRGLYTLRALLSNIQCIVSPKLVSIPFASKKFTEEGQFVKKEDKEKVRALVKHLVEMTRKYDE